MGALCTKVDSHGQSRCGEGPRWRQVQPRQPWSEARTRLLTIGCCARGFTAGASSSKRGRQRQWRRAIHSSWGSRGGNGEPEPGGASGGPAITKVAASITSLKHPCPVHTPWASRQSLATCPAPIPPALCASAPRFLSLPPLPSPHRRRWLAWLLPAPAGLPSPPPTHRHCFHSIAPRDR